MAHSLTFFDANAGGLWLKNGLGIEALKMKCCSSGYFLSTFHVRFCSKTEPKTSPKFKIVTSQRRQKDP